MYLERKKHKQKQKQPNHLYDERKGNNDDKREKKDKIRGRMNKGRVMDLRR